MASRDLTVDTLRGVACILLVTMHVVGHNSSAGIHVPDDSPFRWYVDAFTYLRMPLFSFLAGFVYAWRPLRALHRYPGFMAKKARRLLVPYVIFVPLIGIAQTLVAESNNPTDLSPVEWFLYSLSPYWFLLATFWIFAVIALLDAARLLTKPLHVAALVTVLAALNIFTNAGEVDLLQFGNAASLAVFFSVGLAAERFGWLRAPVWWRGVAAITTVVLFAYMQLAFAGYVPVPDARTDPLGMLLGVSFPLAMLGLGVRFAPLAWVGGFSAGIFLVHPFVVSGTRVVLSRIGLTDLTAQFAIGSVVGVFGSILVVSLARKLYLGRLALGESPRKARASTNAARPV